ncbi:MAG: calcium/sodium antiporter [Cryomorphaceae bacterium]|nr:calcium/sodium antiporter [Cryomorphaceae bacterium]
MSPTILLLVSLVVLFLGGELLVRGSVSLALKMKISALVVAMTIVAAGTGAPEVFVSVQAILQGSSNISLGNVIGSNIINITFILGITAIICRIKISKQTLSLNYPVMLGAFVLLGGVLYFFKGIPVGVGVLFVMIFILFTWFLIATSRKEQLKAEIKQDELSEVTIQDSLLKSIVMLVFSIVLLKFGAKWLVDSAGTLAKNFGISDRIIGVTIVAVGTSIPELVTTVIAALKKENDIAIGNLIGSSIFNIVGVLGIAASLREINIDDPAIFSFDYFWMLGVALVFGFLIYMFSKQEISRKHGIFLVLIYLFYIYKTLV